METESKYTCEKSKEIILDDDERIIGFKSTKYSDTYEIAHKNF